MGDVHLGGSDEGDAHPELLRRLGPPTCDRPDAALRPERDSGFGGDRRGAGDLPRGSGNRLADRLEFHYTVSRSAVRLAGVRCAEPRGVANRSASTSFVYQVQYPLAIDVGTGGSVAYATNSTTHTVAAGTKDVVYVFAGRTVNLTAIPTSVFWAFTGWTGDLAGGAASNAIAVDQPRSIVARFALNWALITAISTVIVIPAVTATVFLVRRK